MKRESSDSNHEESENHGKDKGFIIFWDQKSHPTSILLNFYMVNLKKGNSWECFVVCNFL